ncbi:Hypothetical protein D9617_127g089350 [Elsinoe fawcettii]|nr:Hypothetical protein D9617_127g089350 [Elsinoe fawcettii]
MDVPEAITEADVITFYQIYECMQKLANQPSSIINVCSLETQPNLVD